MNNRYQRPSELAPQDFEDIRHRQHKQSVQFENIQKLDLNKTANNFKILKN